MALIISTHGNATFRTEQIESMYHLMKDNTNRRTNSIAINFKSGISITLCCKTVKEANTLFDEITELMKKDYIK